MNPDHFRNKLTEIQAHTQTFSTFLIIIKSYSLIKWLFVYDSLCIFNFRRVKWEIFLISKTWLFIKENFYSFDNILWNVKTAQTLWLNGISLITQWKKKKSTQGRMMYLRTFLINNVTKLLFWLLDFQYAKLWLKIRGFLHEHNENINHMDCSLSTAHLFYVNFKLSKWTHLVFGENQLFFFVVQFCLALFSGGMAGIGGWGQDWHL